jgi:hypothetical protein
VKRAHPNNLPGNFVAAIVPDRQYNAILPGFSDAGVPDCAFDAQRGETGLLPAVGSGVEP